MQTTVYNVSVLIKTKNNAMIVTINTYNTEREQMKFYRMVKRKNPYTIFILSKEYFTEN